MIAEGRKPYLPQWFPGTRLNYAENLLSRSDDGIAIIQARETGPVKYCSWRQLRLRVTEIAGGLRAAGVKIGDRVAGKFLFHTIMLSPQFYFYRHNLKFD